MPPPPPTQRKGRDASPSTGTRGSNPSSRTGSARGRAGSRSPPSRGGSATAATRSGAPSATGSARKAPSATSRGGSSGSRGGKRTGGGTSDASRKKREKIMIEIINAETLERQALSQQWMVEFTELQVLCEEDSKKTKDHYISILERRLTQMKTQTNSRVDSMEDKFYEILQGITRMLVDTHTLGAVGITEGAMVSELSSSYNSTTASAEGGKGGASSSAGSPLTLPPSKIVSPFASAGSGLVNAALQAAMAQQALSTEATEEKIRRFFANPLVPAASRLENLNVKEAVKRVDELREAVTGLVSQCVARLSKANARVKELEHALEAQNASLSSAEKLLQNALVHRREVGGRRFDGDEQDGDAGRDGHPRPRDVLRAVGKEVRDRLDGLFERLKSAVDMLISKSADAILEQRQRVAEGSQQNQANKHRAASLLLQVRKDEMLDDFLGEIKALQAFQSDILRDIRHHLVALEMQATQTDPLEAAKLFRTNIPDGYRRILHMCDAAYDRDALLRVLDHVSFVPEAAEIIVADIQAFVTIGVREAADMADIRRREEMASSTRKLISKGGASQSQAVAAAAAPKSDSIDLYGSEVDSLIRDYSSNAAAPPLAVSSTPPPITASQPPPSAQQGAGSANSHNRSLEPPRSAVAAAPPVVQIGASPTVQPAMPAGSPATAKSNNKLRSSAGPSSPKTPSKVRFPGTPAAESRTSSPPPTPNIGPSGSTPPPASPSHQPQHANKTSGNADTTPNTQSKYVKALNATAFDLEPSNYAMKIHRPGSGTEPSQMTASSSVRFALTTAVHKFKNAATASHATTTNRGDSAADSPLLLLKGIPASCVVPPHLITSSRAYHLAQLHPDAAGVVVSTDALFATPFLSGYAASEAHKMGKLNMTLQSVTGCHASHTAAPEADYDPDRRQIHSARSSGGVRLHNAMPPHVKRQTILDVLGEAESATADDGGTLEKRFRVLSRNFAACVADSPSNAHQPVASVTPKPPANGRRSPTLPSSAKLFSVKQRELLDDLLSAA